MYVNRSNRPILLDEEYTVFIRDKIGLYQGKSKIVNRQDGRIYLTNIRLIYIDNEVQTNSMAIDLDYVSFSEMVERFLRSSPKVKLFLKHPTPATTTPAAKSASWVCKICSFKNSVVQPVDLQNLPLCQSCGIRASPAVIQQALDSSSESNDSSSSTNCPTCTFINHPSMKNCEICGTQLTVLKKLASKNTAIPPPTLDIPLEGEETYSFLSPYIKVSFRKGGELKFHQALSQILDDIKWKNLNDSGGVNVNAVKLPTSQPKEHSGIAAGGGIRGLEQIGEHQRKLNESILANSLNDLEQLMFKFQDLVHLTKAVNTRVIPEAKQVVPPLQIERSSPLYLPELARNLSEYTTTIFKSPSSMITSQDLFASYNRYLVTTQGFGAALITPQDFNQALALLLQLNLPIAMHKYETSGLVVLSPKQTNHKSYEKFIVEFLQAQYRQYKYDNLKGKVTGNTQVGQFRGSTITEICDNFNWAYDITIEEIQRCVDLGTITIDNHISGTFYYLNIFTTNYYDVNEREILLRVKHDLAAEQQHLEHQIVQQAVQDDPPEDGISPVSLQDPPSTESVSDKKVAEPSPDLDISTLIIEPDSDDAATPREVSLSTL